MAENRQGTIKSVISETVMPPTAGIAIGCMTSAPLPVAHLVRMQVNLVLLDKTANTGDLANPLDRLNLITDKPVLYRAKLGQIETLALNGIPINLPERRCIRPQKQEPLPPAGKRCCATFARSRTRERAQ